MSKRYVIKIVGESGQGINSVGELWARTLKNSGYYVFGYREYPSLIKGGYASHQIELADYPVNAASEFCNLLICLSRVSVHKYLPTLQKGGILIHTVDQMNLTAEEKKLIETRKLHIHFVNAWEILKNLEASRVMVNTVFTGVVWHLLDLPKQTLESGMKAEFRDKPDALKHNLECLTAGYKVELPGLPKPELKLKPSKGLEDHYLMSANEALALGAVSNGVRVYYSYPMTPSSSIITYLADTYHETGIVVKQAEDEITAAQMTLGSMFMGTRALVATSGGGFDLMTESMSLSGMTETPFVCVIGQRPGPATGLPTWTAQADLNLAIYAGHGEFPRCVLAASDLASAFKLVGEAFNIAEKYQMPVLLLTDKQIAECLYQIAELPKQPEIKRNLVAKHDLQTLTSNDRYKITKDGISKRWLPGQEAATFVGNSDEHAENGDVIEDALPSKEMMEKRMRKLETLAEETPEPKLYGDQKPDVLFVGFGSIKNSVLDLITELAQADEHKHKIGYLHFEYLWPFIPGKLIDLAYRTKHVVLIENNYQGQLVNLIRQQTGFDFEHKLLKYDGRPFFIEELINYVDKIK